MHFAGRQPPPDGRQSPAQYGIVQHAVWLLDHLNVVFTLFLSSRLCGSTNDGAVAHRRCAVSGVIGDDSRPACGDISGMSTAISAPAPEAPEASVPCAVVSSDRGISASRSLFPLIP